MQNSQQNAFLVAKHSNHVADWEPREESCDNCHGKRSVDWNRRLCFELMRQDYPWNLGYRYYRTVAKDLQKWGYLPCVQCNPLAGI